MKNNVLLSILGMSPQILTETVYALTQQDPKFLPDEIYVLTTNKGAENCINALFDHNGGWFNKLCEEYGLENIKFSPKNIITVCDSTGNRIDDIRNQDDNQAVANQIMEAIMEITKDDNNALHVSIAGGRKTMGFYAGYAMSMFGRIQDQLSHVLVDEKFESEPDFFYPTKQTSTFAAKRNPPNGATLFYDRKEAQVELAFLPFVRMRDTLDKNILENIESFDDCVSKFQKNISDDTPEITLQTSCNSLIMGDKKVKLTPGELITYYMLIKNLVNDNHIIAYEDMPSTEENNHFFYTCLNELYGEMYPPRFDKDSSSFKGLTHGFLRDRINGIKRKLQKKFGANAAAFNPKLIKRSPAVHALDIDLKKITVLNEKGVKILF